MRLSVSSRSTSIRRASGSCSVSLTISRSTSLSSRARPTAWDPKTMIRSGLYPATRRSKTALRSASIITLLFPAGRALLRAGPEHLHGSISIYRYRVLPLLPWFDPPAAQSSRHKNRGRQALPGQACTPILKLCSSFCHYRFFALLCPGLLRLHQGGHEEQFALRPEGCVAVLMVEWYVLQSVLSGVPGACFIHDRVRRRGCRR